MQSPLNNSEWSTSETSTSGQGTPRNPQLPNTIKMFFGVGWSMLVLSLVVLIYGYVVISDGAGLFLGIGGGVFAFFNWTLEIFSFGFFPGLILIGFGYHLKKTWQASHYPW